VAVWDTTPTASVIGPLFTLAIAGFLLMAFLNRSPGPSNGGLAGAQVSTGGGQGSEPGRAENGTDGATETATVADLDPFFIVGGDIVDPDGNLFVPVGVNGAIKVTDYPYVYEGDNGGINDHLASVQAWGWNTVRATLRCHDESGEPSPRAVADGIDATVEEYTAARVVVILACHDATGSDLELDDELDLDVREFWDLVVPRYRDNPYVWFNFFNEPHSRFTPESWLELHRFYYDRYRTQGVENIMVFDLPNFGQAVDLLAEDDFADELGRACNTLFGWHAWGSLSGVQATEEDYLALAEAVLEKGVAVTITEAGVPQPLSAGTAGNPEWNESGYYAALEVAEGSPIGLLWWHGTGDNSEELFYALKTDKTGFWTSNNSGALTRAGASFWEYSHQERSVEPFTGDLTDSACPSSVAIAEDAERPGRAGSTTGLGGDFDG
jgi:hypothetical protein